MIKLFLKHYIYEYCINLMFSKIKNNFINVDKEKIPKVGEKFSLIIFKTITNTQYFFDCNILPTKLPRKSFLKHENYFRVGFRKTKVFRNEKFIGIFRNSNMLFSKAELNYMMFKK